jgi:hypothetical protein
VKDDIDTMERRENEFQRNLLLEEFLKDLNCNLAEAEQKLTHIRYKQYPVVFVMGALRSGTTLMMQWLANTGEFAYPSNFISRFYRAPIIGAKIQRLLFDPTLNFRNEISDFSQHVDYCSQNGKTRGALAPNEFWYFWRRFMPYESLPVDYLPDTDLCTVFDKDTFIHELMGIASVFDKPLAMKGMIANYNIGFLNAVFDKAVFVYIKREIGTNIESVLEARKRQYGNEKEWYSFRIPEMQGLKNIENPAEQIAGQLYYINQAIETGLENVEERKKVIVEYEDFCNEPHKYYHILQEHLAEQGCDIAKNYRGFRKFEVSRTQAGTEIYEAHLKFMNRVKMQGGYEFKSLPE